MMARSFPVYAALLLAVSCTLRQDVGRLPGAAPPDADGGSREGPALLPGLPSTTTRAGWRWVSPFPTGDDLRGAFGAPSGDLWLLGGNGTVLRRTTDGAIREMLEPDTETRYYAGWATADDDVWIVGERRGATDVRRYDGRRWSDAYSLRDYPVHGAWGAGRDVAWVAAGAFGFLWNGSEWRLVPAALSGGALRAVWASGPNDAWAVGDGGTLIHWEDGEFRDTSPIDQVPVYAKDRNYVGIWGASPRDVWAAYEAPTRKQVGFVHFDGDRWSDTPALPVECTTRPDTLRPSARGARMIGTSESRIVAVLGQGCTFAYDGQAWSALTRIPPLTREVVVSSVAAAGGELYAVGDQGAFLRFDATTSSRWAPVYPALRDDLSQLALVGAVPWALARGRLVRFERGKWETVVGTEGATAFAVGSASEVWFSRAPGPSSDSEIVRRSPMGDEIVARGLPPVGAIASREEAVWIAGAQGFIARRDGGSFETVSTRNEVTLSSIVLIDRATAIATGTKALGEGRFARSVMRVSAGRVEEILADESGSAGAPAFARGSDLWVGGLPTLHWNGLRWQRVPVGDDSPVEGIASAGGASLWLGGGKLLRIWDGVSSQGVFGTGRAIAALASTPEVAWAVGESGATLVFLPRGSPR